MRNTYAGICYRCGKTVAPREGHFERTKDKKWRTQHASCAIKYRGMSDMEVYEQQELLKDVKP